MNTANQVGSRYRIQATPRRAQALRYGVQAPLSRLKVKTRVVVLTSDVNPNLTDFTATFMEQAQW